MSDLFRLDGKIAIITGSSRGIGRAIAETMAAYGAAVVISSRKLEACEATRDAIIAKGGRAIALRCNSGARDDLAALLRATLAEFGRLDAVVANVAVNPYFGPLSGISDEAWDKIMAVNLKSTLWLANLALPEIARQGGGSFTLISSIGALRGSTAIPAYNISKLAEIGLMQNLAVEWGRQKIRVNAILPGLVKTDFARALWENPETLKNRGSDNPAGAHRPAAGYRRRRRLSGHAGRRLYHRPGPDRRWRFHHHRRAVMSGARLIEPLPAHRFDPTALFAYLRDHLEDFPGEARLLQFQGGQSNPTFLLETPARKYVLRKKPPGRLLASAHQIDREYRIQQALRGTDVPVAPLRLYCADPAVIGTEFYIMDFLPGRVFGDVLMPDLTPAERGAVQQDLFTTLGRLHRLDERACGLADFGRPSGYAARQLKRWRGPIPGGPD